MKVVLPLRKLNLAWPVLLLLVFGGIGLSGQEEKDGEAAQRHFTLKVLPLLTEKCFPCHGDDPEEIEGGLVLNTREDMLLGGDGFGDVVVPGKAEESFMMTAVQWKDPDYEMPPKENDRLTEDQIADLRGWIDAGAPWPDTSFSDPRLGNSPIACVPGCARSRSAIQRARPGNVTSPIG